MILFLVVSYNLYYIFLLQVRNMQKLIYLDVLLASVLLIFFGIDAAGYYAAKKKKEGLLQAQHVICHELHPGENLDIAEHDVGVLEEQLREQFDLNCDLQDYIAKWVHEIKIPLSACLLMNEQINDAAMRTSQKEQLERIRQQLNGALLGCKVQSSLFDLQICAVDLAECVRTAIHNNQFFLIQGRFEIQIQVEPVQIYTDKSWFVYVLDQLIQNSVKYASQNPVLMIKSQIEAGGIALLVEDNGEGILERDIRRIFDRGYTGGNHHNGKYKSTGMGLYMVSQILERLEHKILVESEYGVYTQFTIYI